MRSKVTVGIPFYNNQETLGDAIRSVLNQTHANFELILVNDGSFDDSMKVVRSLDDPRIRIVDDGLNKGLSARLNQIAKLTETEFLFRMDADDIMHPERLAVQLARLTRIDAPDLVSAKAWAISFRNEILGMYLPEESHIHSSADILHNRGLVIHPSVAGRTEWFRNNPYREDVKRSEDWELWLRTFDHTRYVRIDQPLIYYRQFDEVNMRNYRIAKKEVRLHRAKYGPDLIGRGQTYKLQASAFFREIIVAASSAFGQTSRVMRKRYRLLSGDEYSAAEQGLALATTIDSGSED